MDKFMSQKEVNRAQVLDKLNEGKINQQQTSNRQAPANEVIAITAEYRRQHMSWNIKQFHNWYHRTGGTRRYTEVKKHLQKAELVPKTEKRGAHRKRREQSALPGIIIHQDGNTHEWIIMPSRAD